MQGMAKYFISSGGDDAEDRGTAVDRGASSRTLAIVSLVLCAGTVALVQHANMGLDGEASAVWEYGRRLTSRGSEEDPNISLTSRSHHKDLFPMDSADIWGTTLIGLGSMIAASGGIGGGGMLVPLLILIFEFSPKYAIPLSNFTIVGSSITNIVLNVVKRHPDADRPLVDWDLILVMEPLTMVGAIVGAFMSKVLPDWLLSISLVILLAVTTEATLKKGFQQWNKESVMFAEEDKSLLEQVHNKEVEMSESSGLLENEGGDEECSGPKAAPDPIRIPNLPAVIEEEEKREQQKKEGKGKGKKGKAETNPAEGASSKAAGGGGNKLAQAIASLEEGTSASTVANSADGDGSSAEGSAEEGMKRAISEADEMQSLLREESRTPLDKMFIMSSMVVSVIVLNLLKGGKKGVFDSPLGIECGSSSYWLVQLSVVVMVLVVSVWARRVLITKWKLKKRLNYKYVVGDVEWNEKNTVIYPAACFFAGFFAGMFGVGGGIVKGPLMLQMGVHPLVASATCAVMIMFTSVAATAMFIAFGTLKWDYAIFLFIIGLTTTAVGQFGVAYLVKMYRRVSLVSLSIGAVVAISTVLMALQSILALTGDNKTKSSNAICS